MQRRHFQCGDSCKIIAPTDKKCGNESKIKPTLLIFPMYISDVSTLAYFSGTFFHTASIAFKIEKIEKIHTKSFKMLFLKIRFVCIFSHFIFRTWYWTCLLEMNLVLYNFRVNHVKNAWKNCLFISQTCFLADSCWNLTIFKIQHEPKKNIF